MNVARFPRLDDLKAERARRRLLPFMERFWPVVEPRTPFKSNWHIGLIAEHLEAVTMRQITDLLINIPPGCMKSYEVSVFWPAWEWIDHPEERYLCGSYDEALAIRDNRRSRDIIESADYQRYWPLDLRSDQNTKTRYDNLKSGWRIGTSVGGKGTGEHPTRKIIDDPHNVKQSLSDNMRGEALSWFSGTMATRGMALNAATIIIMQRLHQGDLSGHVLEQLPGQFVHICLPMRYEPPAWVEVNGQRALKPRMETTPIGGKDPRTEPGELLWPELFDEPKVAKAEAILRSEMGEFGVAGQMAQRPVPEEGGQFKREWFPIVDAVPADARIIARARGWDCAATEGGGDWTAGVRMSLTSGGMVYVEDVVRGQWGTKAFEGEGGILKQTVRMDPPATRQREEQEPGSAGKKLIEFHATLLRGYDYRGTTATGDKQTRARPFAAQCAVGNVCLVRGPWNKAYVDELCLFPNGVHDDQVDGSANAFNEIALGGTVGTVKVVGT